MQDFSFLEKGGHRMEMIKEGDLYKRIEIEGVTFLIYYGYSTEKEKEHGWEPAPQYPAFEEVPQYTPDGRPFANPCQDCCEYYDPIAPRKSDNWCFNCKLFDKREQMIGICTCEKRKLEVARSGTQTDSPSEKTEVRDNEI